VYFGNENNAAKVNMYDNNCIDCLRLYSVSGDENGRLSGTIKMHPGQWYHLAYVYGGTSASLYVNGELMLSTTNFPQSLSIGVTRSENYFGRDDGNRFVDAQLDEIRIYNKALTQSQVKLDKDVVGGLFFTNIC
jgi:hypothetical protein